ncbi:MAG: oxygen-independent coproporphyrinogen oxidase, partial [Pseudomonadota bacterium]
MHIKNLKSFSGDIIRRKFDGKLMTSTSCQTDVTSADILSPELLRRYDVSGPRYTSYPTADRFVEAFGEKDYLQALEQRREGVATKAYPLSLYVHIPFCESLCYYCACNKIITKHHERSEEYLRYLTREVELTVAHMGAGQSVSQLHLGGGSPTFMSDAELNTLMAMLRRNFT